MSTVHANTPREALTRLENMIGMSGINLPSKQMRTQISGAIHLNLPGQPDARRHAAHHPHHGSSSAWKATSFTTQ